MKNYVWIILTMFLLMLINVQALDMSKLKEYYSFDNGISTTINGYNGNPLISVGGSIGAETTGKFDKGLRLTTNQSYSVNLDLDTNQNITINFWAKNSNIDYGYLITFGDTNKVTTNNNSFYIHSYTANTWNDVKYYNPTSESSTISVKNDSTYHMYTLSWINNTAIYYYIDGILNQTITYGSMETMPKNMNYLILGSSTNITVDELSIYNYAVTSSEVTELYATVPLKYESVYNGSNFCQVIPDMTNLARTPTFTSTPLAMNDQFYLYPLTSLGTPYSSQFSFTINGTSGFYGVICNYTESQSLNKNFDNASDSASAGMTNTCGSNNILTYSNPILIKSLYLNASCNNTRTLIPITNPSSYDDATISFTTFTVDTTTSRFDLLNNYAIPILTIYQVYNASIAQMCYYDTAVNPSNIIYCFSYNTSLTGTVLTTDNYSMIGGGFIYHYIALNYGSSTYTLALYLTDIDGHVYGQTLSIPIGFTTQLASYLNFESDKTLWIDNIESTSQAIAHPEWIAYNGTIALNCGYALQTSGKAQVRVYVSDKNISVYNACYGADIVFQTLGQQPANTDNGSNFFQPSGLTTDQNHLIYGIIITFLAGILAGCGIGIPTKNGAVALIAFTLTILIGLVVFGILGWFSIIFAILIGILDAIFIVLGFKMLFFSTTN